MRECRSPTGLLLPAAPLSAMGADGDTNLAEGAAGSLNRQAELPKIAVQRVAIFPSQPASQPALLSRRRNAMSSGQSDIGPSRRNHGRSLAVDRASRCARRYRDFARHWLSKSGEDDPRRVEVAKRVEVLSRTSGSPRCNALH